MKANCLMLVISITLLQNVSTKLYVRSIKCESLDKAFTEFEYCYLKAVNRSYKYISLKLNLYKIPLKNITVQFILKKRANGYKPFLYNINIDACAFLKTRKNPIANFFYRFFESVTNMNHSCPYDHDLIVHKLGTSLIENQMVRLLPFPEGDYGVFGTLYAYNKKRAIFNFYVTIE